MRMDNLYNLSVSYTILWILSTFGHIMEGKNFGFVNERKGLRTSSVKNKNSHRDQRIFEELRSSIHFLIRFSLKSMRK